MRTLKAYILSLALLPIATTSYAETRQTGKTNCKDFAAQQLKEVKQDYSGTLTGDETNLVLQVAERSCRALHDTLEDEKETIRSEAAVSHPKVQWWEQREAEGRAIPAIKKMQRAGGK